MTTTIDAPAKPAMNGVNTPVLLATINAVGAQPELAQFQFRARSTWVAGTHSRITVDDFAGAGGEHRHEVPYVVAADHPGCSSAATTARPRSSSCCRASPPA